MAGHRLPPLATAIFAACGGIAGTQHLEHRAATRPGSGAPDQPNALGMWWIRPAPALPRPCLPPPHIKTCSTNARHVLRQAAYPLPRAAGLPERVRSAWRLSFAGLGDEQENGFGLSAQGKLRTDSGCCQGLRDVVSPRLKLMHTPNTPSLGSMARCIALSRDGRGRMGLGVPVWVRRTRGSLVAACPSLPAPVAKDDTPGSKFDSPSTGR